MTRTQLADLTRIAIILALLVVFLDAAVDTSDRYATADRATQAAVESARTMGQDR